MRSHSLLVLVIFLRLATPAAPGCEEDACQSEGRCSMVNGECVSSHRSCELTPPCTLDGNSTCQVCNRISVVAAVILPDNDLYEPSLQRILPALKCASQSVLDEYNINITLFSGDSRCDAQFSAALAVNAYSFHCANLLIGPTCDYSLAVVARMMKFWGIPLITAGGLVYNYSDKKVCCTDEYYMLVRIGTVAFRDMSQTVISVMHEFSWEKAMLIYDKNGYFEVSGKDTCKLYMETLVEYLKKENLTYGLYDLQKYPDLNFKDHLPQEVGNNYGSK